MNITYASLLSLALMANISTLHSFDKQFELLKTEDIIAKANAENRIFNNNEAIILQTIIARIYRLDQYLEQIQSLSNKELDKKLTKLMSKHEDYRKQVEINNKLWLQCLDKHESTDNAEQCYNRCYGYSAFSLAASNKLQEYEYKAAMIIKASTEKMTQDIAEQKTQQ